MNGLKKYIRKLALKLRAETLKKLLKKSFTNSTTKTVISSTETLTFNTKTLETINTVRENVSSIAKTTNGDTQKLIDYIEAQGTKVYKIHNASAILQKVNETTGLITELKGLKAIYINILTGNGFGLKTKPQFIISDKETDYYLLLREFYLWYSLKMKLAGFDYETQELFKKRIKNPIKNATFKGLNYDKMLKLKEAMERDKEANEFVMNILREKGGDSNTFGKIIKGGADI